MTVDENAEQIEELKNEVEQLRSKMTDFNNGLLRMCEHLKEKGLIDFSPFRFDG